MATEGCAADSGEFRRILMVQLVVCAILPIGLAVKVAIESEHLFPDFFGLWSFGRYVLTHAPATIYDEHALTAFQTGFGMHAERGVFGFFYPPWILLLLAPFGALPYGVARVAWLVLTFGLYVAALTAWRWQRPVLALLLVAPSSAMCLMVGQNGFVIAALMLGGMRLLPTRPLVAGALLGALACKPQFAVLVPFVLLFGRHWRAMAGAALCVALLSLAATLAFGVEIWAAWLAFLPSHAGTLTAGRTALLVMMPTVTSAVLLLGGSATVAHIAQGAAVLAAVLALWRVRARQDIEAQAVLPLATILATPYAFHYDLPMVTGAVLAVIAARIAMAGRFENLELPLLLGCVVAPVLLPARLGTATAIMPVIFAGALWMMARPRYRPRLSSSQHVA